MHDEAALSAREQEILQSIVRAYIQTGEPVSSRVVARRRARALSTASIRNVMADLADEGYLSQPHTSAGRVPTEKAFRSYARSINTRPLGAVETERLRAELIKRTPSKGDSSARPASSRNGPSMWGSPQPCRPP